jgi:hypothetical protein
MIQLPYLRAGALLLAAALALTACSGGNGTPTPSESSPASAIASPESSMVAGSAEPSAAASDSETGFDIGGATDAVSDLTSYQVDITFDDGTTEQEMTIVATRSPSAYHYTMGELEVITIEGEGAWMNQGGTWIDAPGGADMFAGAFDAMAPDTLIDSYGLDAWGSEFRNAGRENRNGVDTTRYHLEASDVQGLGGQDVPDDLVVDVWVAEDSGYLVAMHYSATVPETGQAEFRIEVSRVNDASLAIEPPV